MKEKPIICIQTDFDQQGGAPACMRGVILSVDSSLRVEDLTHNIPKFQPWAASTVLAYVLPCWPVETIFVSVVDPGVGTARKSSVAKTKNGHYIVTPDNGTLTHVAAEIGITEVREIDETINRKPGSEKFHTFHGRDIYAYTAARLASGIITYEQVGKPYPVSDIVSFPLIPATVKAGHAAGTIISANTHFGTVVSNVDADDFEKTGGFKQGDEVNVEIRHAESSDTLSPIFNAPVRYDRSFGSVPVGDAIVYIGSTNQIYVSLNQASFVEKYHVGAGADWQIEFTRS